MSTQEEKEKLIKRKLEAALAELEEKPEALLFLSREEDDYDYDVPQEICGLPVFFHPWLLNNLAQMEAAPVPWIPLWRKYDPYTSLEYIENFNETYVDTE